MELSTPGMVVCMHWLLPSGQTKSSQLKPARVDAHVATLGKNGEISGGTSNMMHLSKLPHT